MRGTTGVPKIRVKFWRVVKALSVVEEGRRRAFHELFLGFSFHLLFNWCACSSEDGER